MACACSFNGCATWPARNRSTLQPRHSMSSYRGYVALTLVYTILLGGYVWYDRRPQPEPLVIVQPTPALSPTFAPTATAAPIQVHVAGAVQRPGVYTLAPNSRLIQAVEAAGGLTNQADAGRVNLADVARDGQQIYIPTIDTPAPPSPTPAQAPDPLTLAPRSGGIEINVGAININTASQAELESLPGIGPALAQRIIAYRESHGPFSDPAQIMEVKGIGEASYERIQERITVR